jgi:hypothetical protein
MLMLERLYLILKLADPIFKKIAARPYKSSCLPPVREAELTGRSRTTVGIGEDVRTGEKGQLYKNGEFRSW